MSVVLRLQDKAIADDDAFRVFCAHKAALTVLNYYGISGGIYFLNNSLDFTYEKREDIPERFSVSIDYMPILSQLRERVNFLYGDDYTRIWMHNKEQIRKGHPVIIGVDQFFLPYHAEYGISHGAHAVVLYGFDEERKQVMIMDAGDFNSTISYQVIHQARISDNSWNFGINTGAALRYASLTLDDTGWPNISESLIELHLQENIKYFSRIENNKAFGYHGLKRMLCQIWEDSGIFDQEARYFRYIPSQLFPQAQKKKLFQYFLVHALKKNCRQQLIDQIEVINNTWNELLLTILKLAYTSRNKSALICDIRGMFAIILTKEARILPLLQAYSLRK